MDASHLRGQGKLSLWLGAPPEAPGAPSEHAWHPVKCFTHIPYCILISVSVCASPSGKREAEARKVGGSSRRPRATARVTHADAGPGAGVRSAVAEQAAALLARLHLGAAVAALAGAHQAAGAGVQHRSDPGGAGRRRLGAQGRARGGTALSRSDLGAGETRRSAVSGGTVEGAATRGRGRGRLGRQSSPGGASALRATYLCKEMEQQEGQAGRTETHALATLHAQAFPSALTKPDGGRCGLALPAFPVRRRPPFRGAATGAGFIARSRDAHTPVGCHAGRRGDRRGGEWNEPRGCHGNWPWVLLPLGRGLGACECLCVATGWSQSAGRGWVESPGQDPGPAGARGKETPVSSWKQLCLTPGRRHRHSPPPISAWAAARTAAKVGRSRRDA